MGTIKTILIPGSEHHDTASADEYAGDFSLVAGWEGQDDKNYYRWVHAKTRSGIADNPIPMKVKLGNAEQAPKILRQLADAIEKFVESR